MSEFDNRTANRLEESRTRVIHVDDCESDRVLLRYNHGPGLQKFGYRMEQFRHPEDAINAIRSLAASVFAVISDGNMYGDDKAGLKVVHAARDVRIPHIVLHTGNPSLYRKDLELHPEVHLISKDDGALRAWFSERINGVM